MSHQGLVELCQNMNSLVTFIQLWRQTHDRNTENDQGKVHGVAAWSLTHANFLLVNAHTDNCILCSKNQLDLSPKIQQSSKVSYTLSSKVWFSVFLSRLFNLPLRQALGSCVLNISVTSSKCRNFLGLSNLNDKSNFNEMVLQAFLPSLLSPDVGRTC